MFCRGVSWLEVGQFTFQNKKLGVSAIVFELFCSRRYTHRKHDKIRDRFDPPPWSQMDKRAGFALAFSDLFLSNPRRSRDVFRSYSVKNKNRHNSVPISISAETPKNHNKHINENNRHLLYIESRSLGAGERFETGFEPRLKSEIACPCVVYQPIYETHWIYRIYVCKKKKNHRGASVPTRLI